LLRHLLRRHFWHLLPELEPLSRKLQVLLMAQQDQLPQDMAEVLSPEWGCNKGQHFPV
jgi:hypothetical protein